MSIAPPLPRRTADVQFFVERYHRAFEDELQTIRTLIRAWVTREPDSLQARSIQVAWETLVEAIVEHVDLQEQIIFPALMDVDPCSQSLVATGTADCASLFVASEGLRCVCAVDHHERPAADVRLRIRLVHFVDELQQHLRDEMHLLTPCTDGASSRGRAAPGKQVSALPAG